MPNPYFSFKQFTVYQDKCAMKVTTDSCILGAYAWHPDPQNILDIGAGTGILGLMMAQRIVNANIVNVEIDDLSANQAELNFKNSTWSARLELIHDNIVNYSKNTSSKFDLIVSNPPYFENQLTSRNSYRNIARHNIELGFDILVNTINKLCAENGAVYTILPQQQFAQFRERMRTYGFKLFDKMSIYSHPGKPVYRIIGGYSKTITLDRSKELVIWNQEKKYTPEYKRLLKDFYLAF